MKLKQREMHIRLDTGVWYNPINKMMNSPKLVNEAHGMYSISYSVSSVFCLSISPADTKTLWVHTYRIAQTYTDTNRHTPSVKFFQNIFDPDINTEHRISCLKNDFHTNELQYMSCISHRLCPLAVSISALQCNLLYMLRQPEQYFSQWFIQHDPTVYQL